MKISLLRAAPPFLFVALGLLLASALPAFAADYTITNSGGTLTVTNSTNNGDALTVAPFNSTANTIQFSASTRTFSYNGVTAPTGSSANIPLSGIGVIVLNTGSGNETVNVSAFPSTSFPSFTITGGIGADTVTFNGFIGFANGSSLSVDLTGSSAGTVNFTGGAQIAASGAGALTVRCSRNVALTNGAVLSTVNGNLNVEANQQATAKTGNFTGVSLGVGSDLLVTGTGALTVKGTGGNDGGGTQYGVALFTGSQIVGGTSGANPVTVTGVGGASASNINRGVTVYGANSAIASSGANVMVNGTGGGSGNGYGIGISVLYSGTITGGGDVTVMGVGKGASGGSNQGVEVAEIDTAKTTTPARISATGILTVAGAAGPNASFGVDVYDSGSLSLASASNGYLAVYADSLTVDSTANITTTATGTYVQFTPYASAARIDLGSASTTGVLGLTDAILDRVFSPGLTANSINGDLTVSAAITRSSATLLTLVSSTRVSATTASASLSVGTNGVVFLYAPFACAITGATSGTGYFPLVVFGGVNLNGQALDLSGTTFAGSVGSVFTVVTRDGTAPIMGTFQGLAEGAYTAWPPSTALKARVSYVGGTGNDVTLTLIGTPTATAQNVSTPFNTAKSITLTGTDPNTPALALTYAVTTQPTHGTLSGTTPNLTYTPTAGYNGSDSFQFAATNTAGLTSAPATVAITVSPGTPTANSQSDFAPLNTAIPITLTGSDPDSPPQRLFYAVTSPAHGTLSGNVPELTYTPNSGYTGADSFTFTVQNFTNTSSPATVSLTVGALVVRNNNATGAGSLVDQINLAASHSGADSITFDPSLNGGTITLSAPANGYAITFADSAGVTLDASNLTNGLTIQGAGPSGNFGLFVVSRGSSLTLRNLTLANGGGIGFTGASENGGAIFNAGTTTLIGCTLRGNSAYMGGAIINSGAATQLTLLQCTLTGNSAPNGGGAIASGAPLTVSQCTITANSGGGIQQQFSPLILANSIVAGNMGAADLDNQASSPAFTASGANIVQTTNGTVSFTGSGTVINAAPLLAPLGSYGGPTQTMPPLPGSPAIDAGVILSIPPDPANGTVFTTDQRGFQRISNGIVDIGAVETSALRVTTLDDANTPTSLRGVIFNATDPATTTITFAPGLAGSTITLSSVGGQITLNKNFALDASNLAGGITLSGAGANGNFRLLNVASGETVVLRNLTLANGGGSNFQDNGGALSNSGTTTATNCVFTGNFAARSGGTGGYGAAIFNLGALTLNQCSLVDNTTTYLGGAIYNAVNLTLNQCTLTGNFASSYAGAIFNDGTTLLNQCTLAGNMTGIDGGAMYNNSGTATLTQCTVAGNHQTMFGGGGGGGIYQSGSSSFLALTNTLIAGNTAASTGIDLYDASGTVTASHCLIQTQANSGVTVGANGNITGNPLLAPLGNYGGPTLTMALEPNSPARNAGTALGFATDQRGFPIVGLPDIGAYEAGTLTTNYNAYIYETLPAGTAAAQYAATADYDGDGVSNYNEFLDQTSAADPTRYLRITSTTRSGNTVSVTFPAVSGKNYYLEGSPDLVSWTSLAGPFSGTGSAMASYTFTNGLPTRYFFHIIIKP